MSAAYWLPGATEELKRATSGVMEAGQALSALLLERRPGASIKIDYVEHEVFRSVACVIMDGLDVAAIASFDLPRGRAWFSVEDTDKGGTAFFVDVRQAADTIIGNIELLDAPTAITDRGANPDPREREDKNMAIMTETEARAIVDAVNAGAADRVPTFQIFTASRVLVFTEGMWDPLVKEVERRRSVDDRGLLPIQPKLSARMRAIAENQPEPPTLPAPGMEFGFPECPGWPDYYCEYGAVKMLQADGVPA